MRLAVILNFLMFLCAMYTYAQLQETEPPTYIKTIYFKGNSAQSQLPVLRLGEPITLEFDVLNAEEDDYYYKIKHFNADWTPSVLAQMEYLSGYDNQRIRNYQNSFNTYEMYSHYKLSIPNNQTRGLKVSGNYMIFIYDSDDNLVFSRKFMIHENSVDVNLKIKRSRDVKFIQQKQRVDIEVSSSRIQFLNPIMQVKALIIQNNNLKTAISGIPPQYTIGNKLIYRYDNETSFWGGNEYFYFENKDVRAANIGIRYIELKDLYHNILYTNIPRVNSVYTYNPDINGNFAVLNIDAENSDIEADYVWVHFSLGDATHLKDKNIHVYGNFNNYNVNNETLMTYDEDKGMFINKMLLKQGFYNYKYVVSDKDNIVDEGIVSGNFYQTENNYKVLIYYREVGDRYDRIVGFGENNSVNITN